MPMPCNGPDRPRPEHRVRSESGRQRHSVSPTPESPQPVGQPHESQAATRRHHPSRRVPPSEQGPDAHPHNEGHQRWAQGMPGGGLRQITPQRRQNGTSKKAGGAGEARELAEGTAPQPQRQALPCRPGQGDPSPQQERRCQPGPLRAHGSRYTTRPRSSLPTSSRSACSSRSISCLTSRLSTPSGSSISSRASLSVKPA